MAVSTMTPYKSLTNYDFTITVNGFTASTAQNYKLTRDGSTTSCAALTGNTDANGYAVYTVTGHGFSTAGSKPISMQVFDSTDGSCASAIATFNQTLQV